MTDSARSRREFLYSSGALLGGAWLAAHLPAIRAAAVYAQEARSREAWMFAVLTPTEARDVEAIAAQIFPTDETPGASEAGVVFFIDKALEGFAAQALQPVRQGLEELRTEWGPFVELPYERQTELLRDMETTPFFATIRTLTVMGMFANPSYGGNRAKVGWGLLGFEDRYVWQPPFGVYDAQVTNGDARGGDQ